MKLKNKDDDILPYCWGQITFGILVAIKVRGH